MASPYAALGGYYDVEYRVNGLWNYILGQRFPQGMAVGNWVLSPEVYPKTTDTSGERADLVVSKVAAGPAPGAVTLQTPRLCYEGKGGASGALMIDVLGQIHLWFSRTLLVTPTSPAQPYGAWAIGAIGPWVSFFKWKSVGLGANPTFRSQAVGQNATGHTVLVNDDSLPQYDIRTNAGWANIQAALTFMYNNDA